MKRISSRATFFYKRIFPLLWLGMLASFASVALWGSGRGHAGSMLVLAPLALMTLVGFTLFRYLIFDLADEVWDDGESLIVRNGGVEQRVMLGNIINVGFTVLTNPPRVTLTLRQPGALGREITFSPQRRFPGFRRSPIIDELIERVDRARRDGRSG